jgi:hypothetical protein
MKLTTISSIVLLFIYFSGKAQIEDRYVSINLLRSYALGDFKAITEKDKMWGVNMELLTPVSQWWPWDIGVEVELLGAGSKTDNFEGLDIDSKSRFWRFGFVNRIRPFKSEGIDPYIEFGYGCNLSYTKTSYTIVDEITFLEWMATTFFPDRFDYQDNVETYDIAVHRNYGHNFSFAIGAILGGRLHLQVKYNYSPHAKFVRPTDITVIDTDLVFYDYQTSEIQTITIGFGFAF